MSYAVTLRKPGRPDQVYDPVPHVGARVELPVDRYMIFRSVDDWRELTCGFDSSIFTEYYDIQSIEGRNVLAVYSGMRRQHELPRTFDPARLPA